jgi:hypothetical protein
MHPKNKLCLFYSNFLFANDIAKEINGITRVCGVLTVCCDRTPNSWHGDVAFSRDRCRASVCGAACYTTVTTFNAQAETGEGDDNDVMSVALPSNRRIVDRFGAKCEVESGEWLAFTGRICKALLLKSRFRCKSDDFYVNKSW